MLNVMLAMAVGQYKKAITNDKLVNLASSQVRMLELAIIFFASRYKEIVG